MKSASNPGSGNEQTPTRRAGSAAGGTQWWKAWLLLTCLGATVLGWGGFPAGRAASGQRHRLAADAIAGRGRICRPRGHRRQL